MLIRRKAYDLFKLLGSRRSEEKIREVYDIARVIDILSQQKYFSKQLFPVKLAVYSCYFGIDSGARIKEDVRSSKFGHYFYSNNDNVLYKAEKLGWNTCKIELPVSRDRVVSSSQAKIPKALPHLFGNIGMYDYLLYTDDKLYINPEKILEIIDQIGNFSLMVTRHPFLTGNVLLELTEAMLQERYQTQRKSMINYITEMLKSGYDLECNMFATGVILRNMRHPDTTAINMKWYDGIVRCGIECQISFDMIAQKYDSIRTISFEEVLSKPR